MLSRVAESIYWMSRQVERAENLARFLEVTLHMILDEPDSVVDPWEPLVQASGDTKWFAENYPRCDQTSVVNFLAFDTTYHSSMLSSLRAARENARGVRDSISTEAFEELNAFYHFVRDATESQLRDPTAEFFDEVRDHALMWTGVFESTMTHDLGWHFANLGRSIERADKTSRILDVKYFNLLPNLSDVGTVVDDLQWSELLRAVSGLEAYRREHHLVEINKVIEFLVFHRSFPRSIVANVAKANESLDEIMNRSGGGTTGMAKSLTQSLVTRLQTTSVDDVIGIGLHQIVDQIQRDLNGIGNALQQDYFGTAVA